MVKQTTGCLGKHQECINLRMCQRRQRICTLSCQSLWAADVVSRLLGGVAVSQCHLGCRKMCIPEGAKPVSSGTYKSKSSPWLPVLSFLLVPCIAFQNYILTLVKLLLRITPGTVLEILSACTTHNLMKSKLIQHTHRQPCACMEVYTEKWSPGILFEEIKGYMCEYACTWTPLCVCIYHSI